MSNARTYPNYHEITTLSNSELAKRTKMASDAFVQAVREGGNVAEKAQIYNAYQDERLKRIKPIANMMYKKHTC